MINKQMNNKIIKENLKTSKQKIGNTNKKTIQQETIIGNRKWGKVQKIGK